jgi:class 3 adenylate cyclase
MFADISGFTALAETMDPEMVRWKLFIIKENCS